MKKNNRKRVHFITLSAMIAALYVVLTLLVAPYAFGNVQLRVSEALCVLVFFTPAAIPGLTIGCFIVNLIASPYPPDLVLGTLATLIGMVGGYLLRKNKWLVTIPTVLANTIIVPLIIIIGSTSPGARMAFDLYPALAIGIFIGELLSATVLGTGLLFLLKKYNFKFK